MAEGSRVEPTGHDHDGAAPRAGDVVGLVGSSVAARGAAVRNGVGEFVDGLLVAHDAYGPRPVWRGRLHLAAAAVALPAVLLLVAFSRSTAGRVATAVYGVTLVGLYAVSASYHRIARTPLAVKWWRRADHSMIFLLIAGTYTPICLLVLPRSWGLPFLAVIWLAALTGVGLKLARLGTAKGSGSWLYGVIGWAAIMLVPLLVTRLTGLQMVLLAAGGILYTVGAIGLGRRWPDPWPSTFGYHEVWHAMTVGAGGLHFAAITTLVAV